MGRRLQRKRLGSDERGSSLLEATVVVPVLFTLGLGIIEFGNMLYRYHLMHVGLRDAARYLSGTLQTATNDAVAKNIAVYGTPTTGTARVSWWTADTVSVQRRSVANDDGSGNKLYRGGDTITMVTVGTSAQYQDLGFLAVLNLGPITLTASHEERVYGNR